MGSDPVAPIAAGGCFLLAAVASVWGWRIGAWLGGAGVAILAGAMAARGLQAGHWPLTNLYEFALAFALGTALAALVLGVRGKPSLPGSAGCMVQSMTLLAAAALVVYARFGVPAFKRAIQPLPPALDSVWFPLHVGTAALGYGGLAMAGAAGLAWLVGERERAKAERSWDRAIAAGYPLLTLSMIFGMIWAQVAWGRYWGWDLKEAWTLITWLVYTTYWHVRGRPRWQGRRLAWLALAGLGAVLFTFLGTGWLARSVGLESLHLF
jgi:ABC-type transport system involved in cytochrome c biogenesis permease subunit